MQRKFIVFLVLFTALIMVACVPTAAIVRDLSNTGYTRFATYDSGGSASENSGVTVNDSSAMPLARVKYSTRAGAQLESLEVYSRTLGAFTPVSEMQQYTTGEDLLKVRKGTYVMQHLLGTGLVVPKSELRFDMAYNFLNGLVNQNFALTCLYQSGVDEKKNFADGEMDREIVKQSKPWWGKVELRSVLNDRWSPYVVSIEGAELCTAVNADWARQKDQFDQNVIRGRRLIQDLEAHGWQGVSEGQGKVYKVVANPTNFNDLIDFQSPFDGWGLDEAGQRYEFRFRPIYKLVNTEKPSFGWAKQNSRNAALQAIVLELKVSGIYQPKAVVFFVKGWFQRNSLYGVKRLTPGETPESFIREVFHLIDIQIPKEVKDAYDRDDLETVLRWENSLPKFEMGQVNTDFVSVVDLRNTTETLSGTTSEGKDTTVQGARSMSGNYHTRGDPAALSLFETLIGDRALEILGMHYIQPAPELGDGWGHVARVEMITDHLRSGKLSYWDAAALDLRSIDSREEVDAALKYFFGAAQKK